MAAAPPPEWRPRLIAYVASARAAHTTTTRSRTPTDTKVPLATKQLGAKRIIRTGL